MTRNPVDKLQSPHQVPSMTRIDDIIAHRRSHKNYDEELWDFVTRVYGRPLEDLSDGGLRTRLSQIDRNIQYLEEAPGPRDHLRQEEGWFSPWYWFRLRHWTVAEMNLRAVAPAPAVDIPPMPKIHGEFVGIHGGGKRQLVRISREPWLMRMLKRGELRFAPATSYRLIEGDEARTDDEMSKGYRRPSRALTITGPDGSRIEPIGEVTFATKRVIGDGTTEVPYWLTSYSSDLDPRLFSDFASTEGDDAVIVIFDPMAFFARSRDHLERAAPRSDKICAHVKYYDAYHPPGRISPLGMKDIRFAYQREYRMSIDPGGREILAGGDAMFVEIGSIEDIAGIYRPDGRRIAGSGPDTFLA